MKYQKFIFLGILIVAFVIVYGQPIAYPMYSSPLKAPATQSIKSTNLTYETIPTSGFANYIGKKLEAIQAVYGEPVETISTGYSYTISIFRATESSSYMEVSTIDQKIVGIKVIDPKNDAVAPFSNGMTMSKLTKITMIYPNFQLKYENQYVDIELSEEDMNYRPLIGFENGTFLILFFDQSSSKLYSMMYLSEELLLKLVPYTMTGEVLPDFVEQHNVDWTTIDHQKVDLASNTLKLLRKREKLTVYQPNTTLQAKANHILAEFLTHPEDTLTTQRVQLMQRSMAGQESDHFILTDEEISGLLQANALTQSSGYLEMPVIDPTFTILSWYSNSFLHQKYMQEKEESLGVAFSKETMLVLLQEKQTTSKESNEP